jgi:hypothetical protein
MRLRTAFAAWRSERFYRVLEQCDQRKAPGSFCRLASAREERGKGRIGEDRAQLIA